MNEQELKQRQEDLDYRIGELIREAEEIIDDGLSLVQNAEACRTYMALRYLRDAMEVEDVGGLEPRIVMITSIEFLLRQRSRNLDDEVDKVRDKMLQNIAEKIALQNKKIVDLDDEVSGLIEEFTSLIRFRDRAKNWIPKAVEASTEINKLRLKRRFEILQQLQV